MFFWNIDPFHLSISKLRELPGTAMGLRLARAGQDLLSEPSPEGAQYGPLPQDCVHSNRIINRVKAFLCFD